MEDEEEEVAEPKRRGRSHSQIRSCTLDSSLNVCSSGSCEARSVKRTLSVLDLSLQQYFGLPLICMNLGKCAS